MLSDSTAEDSQESEASIRDLLQFAEDHGFLAREAFASPDGTRTGSIIGLTPDGRRLLGGDFHPELPPLPAPAGRRPKSSTRRAATHAVPNRDAAVGDLYERLKLFRQRLAQAARKPAYTFFSNVTLADLATEQPRDRDEFLGIKGLGEKRWQSFGTALLAEIDGWRNSRADA